MAGGIFLNTMAVFSALQARNDMAAYRSFSARWAGKEALPSPAAFRGKQALADDIDALLRGKGREAFDLRKTDDGLFLSLEGMNADLLYGILSAVEEDWPSSSFRSLEYSKGAFSAEVACGVSP
jgi:hypothetical protein